MANTDPKKTSPPITTTGNTVTLVWPGYDKYYIGEGVKLSKEQQITNWTLQLEQLKWQNEMQLQKIQLQSDYIEYLKYHKEFFKEEEAIAFNNSAVWKEHLNRMRGLFNESK